MDTEDPPSAIATETAQEEDRTGVVWSEVRCGIFTVLNNFISEGIRQYGSSLEEGRNIGKAAATSSSSFFRRVWGFLTQPVWVPGKKRQPKQYSRGVLFMLDTVRFGGTFAFLFVTLFVAMNYQSFLSIAESYIEPLEKVTGASTAIHDEEDLAAKLRRVPLLAAAGQKDALVEFLPPVGPPENLLIIPKLNLHVPIIVPSNDALLREDWTKLEEDIQLSLQDGVAHYPGTARPGQPGNFFLTGHSSYFPWAKGNYKSVFARLGELSPGDEYWVFYGGDRYRYIIRSKKEIKPGDVSVLDQPVNKRISTMMTCTPVGTTLRRLIIGAEEVDPASGIALKVGEHRTQESMPKIRTELLPI